MEKTEKYRRGVSIQKAFICLIAFMLIISILLLIATGSVSNVYSGLNKNIEDYLEQTENHSQSRQMLSNFPGLITFFSAISHRSCHEYVLPNLSFIHFIVNTS